MHGEQEASVVPRTTGVVLHACMVSIAAWILLGGGIETVGSWFHQHWLPVALAAAFVFFFIPSLSDHLKQKYGEQYDEWAKRTKKFVPFVY
jgi:protein-S-isoprenylcysteine O-methyltransferase Ste14